ncbi:hypothetical protein [Motiliproteus sp. MSK22-1]|uniref:hypothetical protein n=1 Tax=Motiliproteus sp. MSK22-1 TaxID=1897630 RepID=UPI0009776AF3|nr:hypothetical protein [Motiliproteus sp. MSK22-1]OMH30919.1 hypothetical protein BGP75_00870 [Motiliproteus sp. MSK22-1]
MAETPIASMLRSWDHHTIEHLPKVIRKIPISKDDVAKLEALAEVYQLPTEDIIANLISNALREVEEKIPYVQGSKVVRIEEGDPIYEDAGLMPKYLKAKERLERKAG